VRNTTTTKWEERAKRKCQDELEHDDHINVIICRVSGRFHYSLSPHTLRIWLLEATWQTKSFTESYICGGGGNAYYYSSIF
jgi:hypothetical protein